MSDTPQPVGDAPEPTAPQAPSTVGRAAPPDDRKTSSRSSIFVALGLMAALIAGAVAVVIVGIGDEPATADGPRSAAKTATQDRKAAAPTPTGPAVDLQVILATGGEARALDAGEDVAVGDQVVFQVTAEEPARVRVWAEVEGLPHQQLGTFDVEGTAMLGGDEGLAGFGFGNPGPVVFRVSSADEGCPPGACTSWAVIAH